MTAATPPAGQGMLADRQGTLAASQRGRSPQGALAGAIEVLRKRQKALGVVLPLVILVAVSALAAPRLIHALRAGDIAAIVWAMPVWRIAAAIGLTALSYGLLAIQDWAGLRATGHKVPWPTAARGAFTSYALSHNLGLAALTGGSARLHIYGRRGIPAPAVARLVLVAGSAFWGAVMAVAGVGLLILDKPLTIAGITLGSTAARAGGAGLAAIVVGVCALLFWPSATLSDLTVHRLGLRRPRILPAMVLVGALDLACAAGALAVLIPSLGWTDAGLMTVVYALALIATLITHVPGGVGVFEAVMLAGLPMHGPIVLAALLSYRAIYYLLPLGVAVLLNAALEARSLGNRIAPVVSLIRAVLLEAAPLIAAAMTFAGGLVLLLSGALPAVRGRMHMLVQMLPLPFVEASHLSASLVGTALLLVAPALAARLESGASAARLLFMLGAAFSITKGLDIEEAGVMLAMAAFIQFTAPAYYRRTAGAFATHNRGWLVAACAAVALAWASGFHAYRTVPGLSQMWWEFALRGDAPRFLRASFATGVLIAGIAMRELLSRPQRLPGAGRIAPETFARAAAHHPRSDALLALTGDKRFLIHPEGDAFVMFRQFRRTWVVMGDPVGDRSRWAELLWELYRRCDGAFGRLCIYQASAELLPLMIEMGLRPIKYGEEAIIASGAFTLAGPRMKSLRNSQARASRDGLMLRIVLRGEVPQWLDRLRAVSDAWLGGRHEGERGFSLGPATPAYLSQFDIAVVVRAAAPEEPLAFANLWRSGDGGELSVDIMRHLPEAPPGTMDFLLVRLIGLARKEGCERFNLGLAPMSGVRGGKLAPLWARLVNLLFSAGKVGYNYRGMRRFKDKFAPAWEPRYIGLPAGGGALRALLAAVALIHRTD